MKATLSLNRMGMTIDRGSTSASADRESVRLLRSRAATVAANARTPSVRASKNEYTNVSLYISG